MCRRERLNQICEIQETQKTKHAYSQGSKINSNCWRSSLPPMELPGGCSELKRWAFLVTTMLLHWNLTQIFVTKPQKFIILSELTLLIFPQSINGVIRHSYLLRKICITLILHKICWRYNVFRKFVVLIPSPTVSIILFIMLLLSNNIIFSRNGIFKFLIVEFCNHEHVSFFFSFC